MISRLNKYFKGTAGRHETFVPRYGWLTKGFVACLLEPDIFTKEDAIEKLGVGKNMVRSIRFWCIFLGLLKVSENQRGRLEPTQLGLKLIGNLDQEKNEMNWQSGWDPYLEDDASLWLLHWQIFKHPEMAVSWPLAFNFSSLQRFSQKELGASIIKIASEDKKLGAISPNSFNKDAVCIIHMYAMPTNSENEIRCPFNTLGLIEKTSENGSFHFSHMRKNSLPPLIFLAACFSYIQVNKIKEKTISLSSITYGEDAPGVAFKMTETACGDLLEAAVEKIEGLNFLETAGTRQLHFSDEPENYYWECLRVYYEKQ